MLDYLRRLAARVRMRWTEFPPPSPSDPDDLGVRQPVSHRRPGGASAAAVEEPREPSPIEVVAGRR